MSQSNALMAMAQLADEPHELLNEVNNLIIEFIEENANSINNNDNYSNYNNYNNNNNNQGSSRINLPANTSLSIDVAVSLVGLMMDVIQHYQNVEMHSSSSVSVQLYKENESAADVAHQQICRLLNLIARCTDVLLRCNIDQLLLMNVTRRVLSLLREAASANVSSDYVLEEEAKQILRDLHFDVIVNTSANNNIENNKKNNYNISTANNNSNKLQEGSELEEEEEELFPQRENIDADEETESSGLADKTLISSEKSPTSGSDQIKMKRVCFPRANSVDVLNLNTSPFCHRKRSMQFVQSPYTNVMPQYINDATFSEAASSSLPLSPQRFHAKLLHSKNSNTSQIQHAMTRQEEKANSLNDFLAHSMSSNSLMWSGAAFQRSGSVLATSEIPGQQLLKRVKGKHIAKVTRCSSPDNESNVSTITNTTTTTTTTLNATNNTNINELSSEREMNKTKDHHHHHHDNNYYNNNDKNSHINIEVKNKTEVFTDSPKQVESEQQQEDVNNNNNNNNNNKEEEEKSKNLYHVNKSIDDEEEDNTIDGEDEEEEEDDDNELEFAVCLHKFYRDAFDKLQDFKVEIESMEDNLCTKAKKQLHSADTVMTLGYSEAVQCFLLHAAQKDHKTFRVIILTQSVPFQPPIPSQREREQSMYETDYALSSSSLTTCHSSPLAQREFAQTLRFAQELHNSHIAVQILPDSSAFAVMSMCTKVLLGTHAVLANGGKLAAMGSHIVSIAATHFAIPVLIVTSTLHMCPYYPSDKECTRLIRLTRSDAQELPWATYGNPDEVLPLPYGTCVKANGESGSFIVHNPLMEYVPPELITLYATNETEFTPEQVYRVIRVNYNDAD